MRGGIPLVGRMLVCTFIVINVLIEREGNSSGGYDRRSGHYLLRRLVHDTVASVM